MVKKVFFDVFGPGINTITYLVAISDGVIMGFEYREDTGELIDISIGVKK